MDRSSILDEGKHTFVGARTEDMPEPPIESFIPGGCVNCDEPIWAAEVNRREAETAQRLLCVPCMLKENQIELL